MEIQKNNDLIIILLIFNFYVMRTSQLNKNDGLGLFPDRLVEEVQLQYIAGVRYHLDY